MILEIGIHKLIVDYRMMKRQRNAKLNLMFHATDLNVKIDINKII